MSAGEVSGQGVGDRRGGAILLGRDACRAKSRGAGDMRHCRAAETAPTCRDEEGGTHGALNRALGAARQQLRDPRDAVTHHRAARTLRRTRAGVWVGSSGGAGAAGIHCRRGAPAGDAGHAQPWRGGGGSRDGMALCTGRLPGNSRPTPPTRQHATGSGGKKAHLCRVGSDLLVVKQRDGPHTRLLCGMRGGGRPDRQVSALRGAGALCAWVHVGGWVGGEKGPRLHAGRAAGSRALRFAGDTAQRSAACRPPARSSAEPHVSISACSEQ